MYIYIYKLYIYPYIYCIHVPICMSYFLLPPLNKFQHDKSQKHIHS